MLLFSTAAGVFNFLIYKKKRATECTLSLYKIAKIKCQYYTRVSMYFFIGGKQISNSIKFYKKYKIVTQRFVNWQLTLPKNIAQQQQQNFSSKSCSLFLAMMKFIKHTTSQAKKLNQLVDIASWSAIPVLISLPRLQLLVSG